ncbi:polynucleotide 5'-hydroxyl-kinase NOL9-like [Anopheles albimanus]|uniref:Polynucleotide 5'-hydroxyl-kinase NOL9 n=1 Tax=Anopheles albimanus TaxID=7167 RepID=A0A182FED3_ANOAL|nr:polynucleotide 5'-hydroxyl-kinase NOL9-like [Anopheles albimanus]
MGNRNKQKQVQRTTGKENHQLKLKTNFKAKSKAFAKGDGTPVINTPKTERPAAKTSNKATPRDPPEVAADSKYSKKNTQVTAKPSKSPVPNKKPVNNGNGIDRIDTQNTAKPSGMKNGTDPRNAVPPKKRPPPAPFSSSTGWVVEDAEVALRYSDSDDEAGTAAKKRKNNGVAGDAHEDDYLAKYIGRADEYDEESDYESDDYDSEDYESMEGSSFLDEQSSDDDSEEWTDVEEYDDDTSDSEDSVQRQLNNVYEEESETDEDYVPSSCDEDLYIPRGAGKVYDCDDDTIEFDNDEPQIIELPPNYGTPSKQDEEEEATAESDASDSCPSLVPIYNEKGEFIDDVKLLPGKGDHEEPVAEEKASSDEETLPIDNESDEEASAGAVENYHFYDAIDRHMSLVMMKKPLHLYGHVSVQALFGKVEIMGYTIDRAERRTVYAARGYNAVNLTPIPEPETFQRPAFEAILQKLKSQFTRHTIEQLLKLFNPTDYVLVLLEAQQEKRDTVRIVHRYLEEYDLFPACNTTTTVPLRATEYWLNVRLLEPRADGTSKFPLFQANPAWNDVMLGTDSRLLVLGGKGAGKSTLCQFLLNSSIKTFDRILLIDLDIGQPLLTAPEMISATVLDVPLLGVACFTAVQQQVRCQLFGSLNVVTNPIFYVQNVRSLLEHCENTPSLRGFPWIINTMGYVSGFGEELTAAIMRLVQPTDVIQLTIPGARERGSENYRHAMTAEFIQGYKFNILQNEIVPKLGRVLHYKHYAFGVCFDPQACPLAAPKRRNVSLMVQLVKILDEETECFTAVHPVSAPLDDLEVLITRDEYQPTKEMLPNVINATLVYLCEKLEHEQYNCLGAGIVRAVDDERKVHLIHSLTPQQLGRVKVLALCHTSLPSQISLKLQPTMKGTIPYLQNVSIKQIPPAPVSSLPEEPLPSDQ